MAPRIQIATQEYLPHTWSDFMTQMRNQTANLSANAQGPLPGWGFGFGGSVLVDPAAAGTPQSRGTWQWGGVYGHSWFVDPERKITVIALTNTALEGMIGRFPIELRDAVYRTL